MDDGFEVPPPRDTVPAVMRAKLFHAQAVLEAIVLAQYAQAESNAMALKRISQSGDWLAHESAAYFEFSAEFRNVCDDLVNHSRMQDLRAMGDDYANLTQSCVACHDFLRMERQSKDMPGRRSERGGRDSWLAHVIDGQPGSLDQGSFPVAD
jgi:hypothetical protein